MREKSAGIVVIGNEILSGKVEDTNSAFLARELRQLGVALKRITVIPDELEVIAEVVRDFHQGFDVVFTSGGVGPTHDDITMEGVALALGRRIVRHPLLEGKIRKHLKEVGPLRDLIRGGFGSVLGSYLSGPCVDLPGDQKWNQSLHQPLKG